MLSYYLLWLCSIARIFHNPCSPPPTRILSILTVSCPFAPAFAKADMGIETISSGAMLLLEELPLCPLYAEWSIDIALNVLDRVEVLENTRW
jgi:hypothetical protein